MEDSARRPEISAERWAQVEPLVDAALELPPPERSAFLDGACSDGRLRADVERLVAACERPDARLDDNPVARFAWLFDEEPPRRLNDRFFIEREIGRGGMATVYLAHDEKHDRPVAVKVLGPATAAMIGSERFRHEITLAARLQHAHIVPLYDSGDHDGWLYYVMPVMNGGSLRERLVRDGTLDLAVTRQIAADVAEALAYAHARGFVHRDIKPENILFDGAPAMLADFGIARALGLMPRSDSSGRVTGTPAYMSPEQAAGATGLDARSDVYSLGAVVYEMLTGDRPSAQSLESATALRSSLRDLPSCVDDALCRALAPAPEARFGSADEFVRALAGVPRPESVSRVRRRAATALTASALIVLVAGGEFVLRAKGADGEFLATGEPSLAVLPLSSASGDSASESFVDGTTDALIAAISHAGRVRVVSGGFGSAPARTPAAVRRFAEAVHVQQVLEGTLERAGSRLRLSVVLVDAQTGSTRWSNTYEEGFDELFATEDEIGRAVVAALGVRVAASKRPEPAPGAFGLYLRGSELHLMRTDSMARVAVGYFLDAIAADPSFVPAYAGLGRAYSAVCQGLEPLRQRLNACDSARIAAKRAVALDSTLADGFRALAYASLAANDIRAAETAVRRAVALDPNNEESYEFLSVVHHWLGRHDEALVDARRALDLNPLALGASAEVGRSLFYANRGNEALVQLEPLTGLKPPVRRVPHLVGRIYEKRQMWLQAATEYKKLPGASSVGPLGRVLAESGQRAAADSILSELEAEWEHGVGRAWDVTTVLVGLHDFDAAFRWIDRAIDDHSLRVDVMDPTFDEFRADPRFGRVLRRLGITN